MAKKPRYRAPEGEFARLTDENSFRLSFAPEKKLPVDIGIELPDGRMQVLVKRGKSLPFQHNEMYSTASAYQTSVEMHFLVGNRPLAKDNQTIGRIRLNNIRWSNQGLPALDVLVEVRKGTLAIGSNNLDRTRDKGAVSDVCAGLSADDIEKLLADARDNEERDAAWQSYIAETDDGRQLINELADMYAAAKKKMSFSQKREHNKIVNRVCKALNSPLKKMDDESIAQYRADIEALKASMPHLRTLQAQVMGWYK